MLRGGCYLNFLILVSCELVAGDVLIQISNKGFFDVYLGVSNADGNTPPLIDFVLPETNSTVRKNPFDCLPRSRAYRIPYSGSSIGFSCPSSKISRSVRPKHLRRPDLDIIDTSSRQEIVEACINLITRITSSQPSPTINLQEFFVPNGWSGMIWVMTNCFDQGGCDTGGCDDYPQTPCKRGPNWPYTAAFFTLADANRKKNDFYRVSASAGYNCDVKISPIPGTYREEPSIPKFCQATTSCTGNLLIFCPEQMQVYGHWGLVGCMPGGSESCDKCGDVGANFYMHYCPTSYIDRCDEFTSEFTCGGPISGTSARYSMEITCPL